MSVFFKPVITLVALCFFSIGRAQEFSDNTIAYTYPGYALNIDAGDVNGDGFSDLVIASSFTQDVVSLMINDGNGGYVYQHLADVNWPDALFGDMDGDGDLDVVVLAKSDKKIGWYKNHGEGNFFPIQYNNIGSNLFDVRHMQLHDFDYDGDMDVVFHYSATGPDKAVVKLNNGNGSFSTMSGTASSGIIRSISAGDMDGDGDMDLLCGKSGDVVWFENLNNTGFGPEILLSDDLDAEYVIAVHLLDYDKDGDADPFFGTINYTNGQVSNTEVGMFESYTEGVFSDKIVLAENTFNQGEIIHADVDGDGDMDILTSSDVNNTILWYENTGCDFQEQTISSSLSRYTAIEVTDVNTDGQIDILVNGNPKRISLYTNQTPGVYSESIVSENGGTELAYGLHASDMDNDGDLDLLSTSIDDDKIAWYENTGNKTFSYQRIISTQTEKPKSVATADFDGDGDMDVVSAFETGNTIKWFKQESDLTFSGAINLGGSVVEATSVYAADLDNDGYVDILSSSYEDKKIAWYPNNGNGTFGWQNVLSVTADGAQVVLAAYMDDDTLLDVLYASINDHTIGWFQNNGNSTFNNIENVITDSNTFVTWIDVMDVENDGDLDVISCSALGGGIFWYENDGTGSFGSPQVIDNNEDYGVVSMADIDLDGDLDILATKVFDDEIVWIENSGSGTFGSSIQIASDIEAPRHILGIDVDSDGDQDVVTSGYIDETIFISENLFHTNYHTETTVCDTLLSPDGNTVYTESGIYQDTLINIDGGDSIIITHLYVVEEDSTELNEVLCYGDTFYIENTIYTESGSYTHVLNNQCGLDSTILLNLYVSSPDTTTLIDTICANECFRVGNVNYTTTGSYIDTLVNQCGFDSLVYTSLFVNESSEVDLDETLCAGDTLVIGNQQYFSTGVYNIFLESIYGCDSIINLDMDVITINNNVNVNGTVLTAANPNADAYQWVDCNNNNAPISGATSSSYPANSNGSYAVILTVNGCDKISECKIVQGIGLAEDGLTEITMFPNPTQNNVQIQFNQEITSAQLKVTDMIGREHISVSIENTDHAILELESIQDGVYTISCYIENTQIIVKRIVKNSK